MERILVILNRAETAQSVLAAAGHLRAALVGSQLDVLHPRPDIDPSFMPTEEVWTDERRHAFEAGRDTLFQHLLDTFKDWQSQEPWSAGLQLRQAVGKIEETIGAEAKRADLLVLGSAGPTHATEAKQAIDAALMDASVLLIPQAVSASLGKRIAVAWERSRAADEAIGAALPLLLAADQVTVLMADERHGDTSLPSGLLQALEQNGTAPTIRRFELNGREIGKALLEEARRMHADLLVMGAFTHNRTLEAIFGGATRGVLAGADLPVLMHR